jgi:4-amino-4-deoxy-L-arabinose transferase-like glycosyltransferase
MRFSFPMAHAAILLAISLPYFINLGSSSIWDASEAFYAETPREMIATGDYLAPHFNFMPRTQKPPLTYWIIAASYNLFGVSEFSLRLPGAFAAVGVMLFSYGIAWLLFRPRAALLAAMVTATTARVFILARRLPIDIFLLLFLMGALFFLVRAILTQRTRFWLAAYIFCALGFLTKGPVALFIPAAVFLLWILVQRRTGLSQAHVLSGAIAFAAVVFPWYLLIFLKHGWTYIAPFFLKDNLGRFASENFGPARGLFYYFGVGISDFFPWSILALCAFVLLWRFRKTERPLKRLEYGLPVLWCLLVFAFFSLSKNKQEYYIAPVYPVAAVVIAGVLDRMMEKNRPSSETHGNTLQTSPKAWWLWAFGFQAFVLFLFSLSSFYIFRLLAPDISPVLHYAAPLALVAGASLFVWSVVRRKLMKCFFVLTALLWVMYMMCVAIYLPALEQYRPVKAFCRIIETQLGAGDEAGYFRTALPSMAFYLRRPIFEESDAAEMRSRLDAGKRVFCILSRRAYYSLLADKAPGVYILARQPRFTVGVDALLNARYAQEEELLLISNRPGADTKSTRNRAIP